VLQDYEILDKTGAWICDNASSNNTALEELGRQLKTETRFWRIKCAGHIFNLIAGDLFYGLDYEMFDVSIKE
ncbi:hypothetical protein EJ04DRAFT_391828, partial [Polyplosphaeria fusca]